jgi:hypothetical protein
MSRVTWQYSTVAGAGVRVGFFRLGIMCKAARAGPHRTGRAPWGYGVTRTPSRGSANLMALLLAAGTSGGLECSDRLRGGTASAGLTGGSTTDRRPV